MTDTDIKALVERLRIRRAEPWTMSLMRAAADALEARQAEIERLVEQAIANDAADRLITVDEIRRAALEEAAQVADPYGWCGYGKEICGPKIAAAIRALAGDKP